MSVSAPTTTVERSNLATLPFQPGANVSSPPPVTAQTDVSAPGSQLESPKAGRTNWGRVFGLREQGVYYALILLVAVFTVVSAVSGGIDYLSIGNLTNVLYQSSLVAIMAVAITVVLITGNFDLSVASVAALAAVILMGWADTIGFWPAAGMAMLAAAGVGLLNGVIVELVGINAFIVTLGTLTAIRGLVLILTDGRALSTQSDSVIAAMGALESGRLNMVWVLLALGVVLLVTGILQVLRRARAKLGVSPASVGFVFGGVCCASLSLSSGGILMVPYPVLYMALFAGLVWAVLSFTIVGRRVYAVGGNPEAARLSGVNVARYKILAFVLSGAAAGFAGILLASRLRSVNPAALTGAELSVIAAAILGGTSLYGGTGTVIKTLAGAFLLFALTNGFNILNLGANYQGLIEGTVIVVAAAMYTVGSSRRK